MSLFSKCSERIREVMYSMEFKIEVRKKASFFTRLTKKLTFVTVILLIMKGMKKSNQTELNEFVGIINILEDESLMITSKAFSASREKLYPKAFEILNDEIVHIIYQERYKTFRNYRLLAIDGSTFEIPDTPKLRKYFGESKNQNEIGLARAHAAAIYDTQNDIILESTLDKYPTNERTQAMKLIEKMNSKHEQDISNDLYLFDRGYPSAELIEFLQNRGNKYVMRVNSNFLKSINDANLPDQIVEGVYKKYMPNPDYKKGGKQKKTITSEITYKVRVITLVLPSGQIEKLITNIFDEDYTVDDFKKLYFIRWGIEVKYDILKNRLQMENFSGQTVDAILQDFYAAILLSNLVALSKAESDEIIENERNNKNNKHNQQTNINQLIPILLPTIKLCVLTENIEKRLELYDSLIKIISKHTVPMRPDREVKRNKKKISNKYHQNARRCI